MKRKSLVVLLALLIALLAVSPVAAKNDKVNIKGEVTALGAGTLTVQTAKGESYQVIPPADFDLSTLKVGSYVLLKGKRNESGAVQADFIKVFEEAVGADKKDASDKPEGKRDNSAYCSADKPEKVRALAVKIAERYGVEEAWVMDKFCGGYSMGAIMLALKTSALEGVSVTPDALLTELSDGKPWGEIWQDLGLKDSKKDGRNPQGKFKKDK